MRLSVDCIFCFPRTAMLATVMLGSLACGSVVHAQSPDPATLRQIKDRLNHEAAAATWGSNPTSPTIPSAPAPDSQSSYSNSGGSHANIGGPAAGSSGYPVMDSGGGTGSSPNSTTRGSSPNLPDASSPALPVQPSTQSDTTTQSANPTPSKVTGADDSYAEPKPTTKPLRAEVTYVAGLLTVHAHNSSLNQTLRQIAQLTGLTISGGVADERIFGDFGPSKASDVVAALLEGCRTNVVLRVGPDAATTELILTPRGGGAIPPSPTSSVWDSDDDKSGK